MNIQSLSFNRLLQNNIENISKFTEQFSTGKRINQSSDDASDLQVSTRLTSQIRGTKQATRNIQDGISLLNTADAGLSTIQDMLQRLRELAVQGKNGTYNTAEKASIENEMKVLLENVNQVASNTKFNTISLLNNDQSVSLSGIKTTNQSVKIENIPVNTAPGAKTTVELWMYWDGTANSMPFGWNSAYAIYLRNGMIGFNSADSNLLGASAEGLKDKWTHIAATFINGVADENNVEFYINGEKQAISDLFNPTVSSRTVTPTIYVGNWTGPSPITDFGGRIDELKIWDGQRTQEEIKGDMYASNSGNEENLLGYWKFNSPILIDETSNGNNGQFIDGATLGEGVTKSISIHTGSDSNSTDSINLFSLTEDTLNLSDISLSDPDLIKNIDAAINAISIQRGGIGSKINRYNFKLENKNTLINNTEAARMRIEDLNMSSAMSDLTKEEIKMNSVQRMMKVSVANYEQKMNMLFN